MISRWQFGRVTIRLVHGPRFAWVFDRFPGGTVYRVWVGWVLLKLMVKANTGAV